MSRVFIGVILFLFVGHANALPLPKGPRALQVIPETFTTGYDFEGIIELSNCSGSLIQFENSKDTDNAMVMTNGHCLEFGFPETGTFVYHKSSSRTFKLLNSSADAVARLHATEVIYSTMTKTDVTLYKLSETFANIKSQY